MKTGLLPAFLTASNTWNVPYALISKSSRGSVTDVVTATCAARWRTKSAFLIAAVRDFLYIDDLLDAYDKAALHIDKTKGMVFNIGGGSLNTISVWFEFVPILEELFGKKNNCNFRVSSPWRSTDFCCRYTVGWKNFWLETDNFSQSRHHRTLQLGERK